MCTLCTGETSTTVRGNGGKTIELCDEHAKLHRTPCPGCGAVLRVGNATLGGAVVKGPVDVYVCDDCAPKRAECAECKRVVRIGGKPVSPHVPHPAPLNVSVCKPCTDVGPVLRCDGCDRVVQVGTKAVTLNYVRYAGGAVRLCKDQCEQRIAARCRVCDVPAGLTAGSELKPMSGALAVNGGSDGTAVVGWRCAVCAKAVITDQDSADKVYGVAAAWIRKRFEDCGLPYPNYGDRLKWSMVSDDALTDKDGDLLGHCRSEGTAEEMTHQIRVLTHMRVIPFAANLVHELTHAWANQREKGHSPKIEGFCNYVEYLFLNDMIHRQPPKPDSIAEATALANRLAKMTDDRYGKAFVEIRDNFGGDLRSAAAWFQRTV